MVYLMNKNRYLFSFEDLSMIDMEKIEDCRIANNLEDAHSFISSDLNIDIEEIKMIDPYLITYSEQGFKIHYDNRYIQHVDDIYNFINDYIE